jgi:hypothetical protein
MWQNFTDIEKYELPLSPKRPSGKVVHAQFEDTNNGDLYLPAARICYNLHPRSTSGVEIRFVLSKNEGYLVLL